MEVKVRDVPVYYEQIGSGIPLLMLHGRPTDHRWLAANMEKIFEHRSGWRRIYPDLPGQGKTPGADWIKTQDDVLDVLIEFMQAVAPGERFVVAGLSYGGYLGRGLIYKLGSMIDGICIWIPQVETDADKLEAPSHQTICSNAEFQAALTPDLSFMNEMAVVEQLETIDWFQTYGKPAFALADFPFLESIGDMTSFSFPVDRLPEPFAAPSLIVAGRQDSLVGYKPALSLLENYSRGTFAVLDRAGHFLDVEQMPLLHALTNEWLDRVAEYIASRNKCD